MSKAERRALRRLQAAMRECHREEFILDGLDVARPREIERWARDTRKAWERHKGREGSNARVVLDELAAAAQGYADVHERAEAERARQGAES